MTGNSEWNFNTLKESPPMKFDFVKLRTKGAEHYETRMPGTERLETRIAEGRYKKDWTTEIRNPYDVCFLEKTARRNSRCEDSDG